MTERAHLSVLDFCTIYEGETPAQSIARSVQLAQEAEKLGYSRMWYTEHHNMKSIMSSSPAVLIAHIGAKTEHIRLGSGGVMLPNHSPYVIAEQFGTLEEMYPERIDLGVGRAPGTDMNTLGRALRRDAHSAERFPEDVKELNSYLEGKSYIPGVSAIPGANTNVPIYILGSSMFGASLAAKLGLPYVFAHHFAGRGTGEALDLYRKTSPKMVLADIQLADGSSGIDAVNEILTQAAVPVIFITAFPERLLTGKRPEPAFLVTKPFNPDMVKALISQALFFDEHARSARR